MFYYVYRQNAEITALEARSSAFCEPDGEAVQALTQQEYEALLASILPKEEG